MTPNKIRALLFDLDDTLLINDMEQFARPYFQALVARMSRVCAPRPFMEALQVGTEVMLRNDGCNGVNAQVFADAFFPRLGRNPQEIMPHLESFYQQEFETLQRYTERDPLAHKLVSLAFERGYQVAVATQPIFPLTAIRARLRWAGVGDDLFPYDLITSYEEMSACKPNPLFFGAILQRLGRKPEECLMVGDSIEADMPAAQLGIKTFWVDRGRIAAPPANVASAQGNLADLIRLIETGGIDEL